jgi:hypothetical protein
VGVEVYLHAFLTSALDVGEWPTSRPVTHQLKNIIGRTHLLNSTKIQRKDKRLGKSEDFKQKMK